MHWLFFYEWKKLVSGSDLFRQLLFFTCPNSFTVHLWIPPLPMLAFWMGIFLSIPFLPPIDAGIRPYAATAALLFLPVSLVFSLAMSKGSEPLPDERRGLAVGIPTCLALGHRGLPPGCSCTQKPSPPCTGATGYLYPGSNSYKLSIESRFLYPIFTDR
jgi:hypothetical protein